jgi:cobalt-zinc-cadmium efflux system outer membrane protein
VFRFFPEATRRVTVFTHNFFTSVCPRLFMPKLFTAFPCLAQAGGIFCAAALTAAATETNATPVAAERLTLQSAAALALTQNPSLRAHGYDLRAAEARQLQAKVRPNPELSLDVEDVLGSGNYRGGRSAQTTLQLSQLIELGGKRSARSGIASAQHSLKQTEAALARVEVLAAVAGEFIHVLGDQHELTLSRDATKLAEETLALAQRRIEAGNASPIEEKRARIQLAKARLLEEHDEHELQTARRKLAALWGATNATFTDLQADLFVRPAMPSFEELAARIQRSPELTRWASEKSVRDAEVKLADARRRPDLTAGAGVRQYAGPDDVGFVFQFSLPLPLSDRQQGARAEARALAEKTVVERDATELRLRTALFGIAQELSHADTELNALDREMIPDAEAALQLARDGFERARFSQFELLDAQRTLLELRLQRIQAAVAYHQYVIEIEKILGEPLAPESVQSIKPTQP